jgi:hypothetical protein
MCQKIRTVQRFLCGWIEEDVNIDLCEDYEQSGECLTPPEHWDDKEPANFGSKRVRSKCAECEKKGEKSTQETNIQGQPSAQSQYFRNPGRLMIELEYLLPVPISLVVSFVWKREKHRLISP